MAELRVVGIGPGDWREMTLRAHEALENSDVIVGYQAYVDIVRERYPQKEYRATGMRGEVERCQMALELARAGRSVAMVCSGDAGIYGMAGLILELRGEEDDPPVEIIGGQTAAIAGAARLGAPLGHDFAVISLSDLLTPWETIEKRLDSAASAGLAIALYNPGSHRRQDALKRACAVLLRHLSVETVCGVARNIAREGESAQITTLAALMEMQVDMFATVFIGNAQTRVINGRMVTPRGYRNV